MSIDGKHAYRFGYLKSEKWQNVRLETLVREHGKCQICGEESIHNDAHHIWYPRDVYDTTPAHLIILCRDCHEFLHTMTPECKTQVEAEGRAIWAKLRKAILHWRQMKDPIFKDLSDIAHKFGAADLRIAYDKLKDRTTFIERSLEEYKARFGELNDVQLYKPTVAKGMDINQQYEFIRSTIKEWMNAYKDSARLPNRENTVDSSDHSI